MKSDLLLARLTRLLGVTVCCTFASQGAFSQEAVDPALQWQPKGPSVELRAGAAYSDNVTKSDAGQQGDTIASAGIGLDYNRVGSRLEVKALADIDWVEYLHDSYDAQAMGYFDGSASLKLVEDSFVWDVRETFGQLTSDPLLAETPDNTENLNYFSTGPRLNLRLGDRLRLSLYGAYSLVDYEVLQADNDQVSGGLELAHPLSDTSAVSLNVTGSSVNFDDAVLNSDYDMQSAFLRYEVKGRRTSFDADAGYSQIKENGETSDGVLLKVGGSRRLSPSTNFFLRLRQQFSNAGNLFRDGLTQGNPTGQNTTSGISSADVFKERGAGMGFSFERARTQMGIGGDWSKEEYEEQTAFDRRVLTIDAYLLRHVRPSVTVQLIARYESERYENTGFDDDRLELGVLLQWQLASKFGVDLRYDYGDRSAPLFGGDFSENRYSIRFAYRPLGN